MKAEIIFIGNGIPVEDSRQDHFGVGVSVRDVWMARVDMVDGVKHYSILLELLTLGELIHKEKKEKKKKRAQKKEKPHRHTFMNHQGHKRYKREV